MELNEQYASEAKSLKEELERYGITLTEYLLYVNNVKLDNIALKSTISPSDSPFSL